MDNEVGLLEHEDSRKHTDPLWYNIKTGETSGSLGWLAKRKEVLRYTIFCPEDVSIVKRIYFAYKRFVAKCTPESIHHLRRESQLNAMCGF